MIQQSPSEERACVVVRIKSGCADTLEKIAEEAFEFFASTVRSAEETLRPGFVLQEILLNEIACRGSQNGVYARSGSGYKN